jgi:uncharacterized coiled-coil protein SlyX
MATSPSMPSPDQRLENIESVLAHLQHDVDSLNASLLNQLRRLQQFESRFSRLEHEMQMIHAPQERSNPDPGADRPPHY